MYLRGVKSNEELSIPLPSADTVKYWKVSGSSAVSQSPVSVRAAPLLMLSCNLLWVYIFCGLPESPGAAPTTITCAGKEACWPYYATLPVRSPNQVDYSQNPRRLSGVSQIGACHRTPPPPPSSSVALKYRGALLEILTTSPPAHGLDECVPRGVSNKIILDPLTFSEARFRPSLEERLESIISGAALMADSSCTRDDRRERIVAECNAVRQALQDLLSEYMNNTGRKEKGDPLNSAIDKMTKKTRDLRRQLRKAVMDHISDSFLETNVPLLVLIEAAKSGNEKEVKEYAQVFREHANKLVEVANLACSISNNEEGVKLVRMAATQIDSLCPQVINAALTLAARPQSKVAQDNMDVFKDQWEKQVRILTEAVDDITSVDDFLSVSENHILEDVNKCVIALQEGDVDTLDRTAGAIRGRAARVVHIINAEMENYEPGVYTERVLESIKLLSETVMPRFAEQVEVAIEALSTNPPQAFEENEFIDASRLVYDGVRDIRKAVLMIRTPEELEDDSDFEQEDYDTRSRTSIQTEDDQLIAGQSARAIMAQLPQEEKAKIAEQVESFRQEKCKLDAEVAKWDDNGNDIIVLAKQMCMIMMEMTDFTRGKGPLKNSSDVINAAKKIAEAGSRMDKLARAVADQCPDSACKQDLLAYLQRIALYCHQLNICSKVKLDSATSLIQAAKNLMNAVVLTVKASYVASTKYQKVYGTAAVNSPVVSWRMKAPEKKPLVKREKPEECQTRVRRGSQKKHISPVQALSEFKAMDSF
ncbi:hypothetical protein WMY93_006062 [Mugilogobius chulae]|uniref:Catenin alpha-2 n=1 Tax=Mugilogobius chulae TaxID=88201 RepID=A0AAW0PLB5_9GOBI